MLDPRLYRAGLIPLLLAVVVVAFSLADRPRPVRTTLAADAFDATRAYDDLRDLAQRHPERRPGSPGDRALGDEMATAFAEAGFQVRSTVEDGETIDGSQPLRNVIAHRPGTSDERIVVVAHRDAAQRGSPAELSATAALRELARVYGAPRRTKRTLTLVSTSGGSGGNAGAARLASEQPDGVDVSAVLVLGDLASRELTRRPVVVPWSNGGEGLAPLQLRRTVQAAVEVETGRAVPGPRTLVQGARLALPFTPGAQGVVAPDGLPAVMLSVRGDRIAPAGAPVSRARLDGFGRAALRTVTALDNGPSQAAPATTDLLTARKVLPGWTVTLVSGALLLPVALTVVDGFARARRRREAVGAGMRWTLAGAVPFALAALLTWLLGLVGLLPAAPGAPVDPRALSLGSGQAVALAVVGLAFVLAWLTARPLAVRAFVGRGPDPRSPGAAAGLLVVLTLVAVVVWALNPFAALLLIPALHAWLLAVTPDIRLPRSVGLALLALGLVPLVALGVYVARALGAGPLDMAWQGLVWVAGGHLGVLGVLLATVLAGCAVGVASIVVRPHHDQPAQDSGSAEPVTSVRGPLTYAGPGSLGGTESALRR
ncbi:MAG TPA: M28 family peptidase [Solirubrobacteraceae bacterium]|nr:M28 family peptidase [Solirubrobacteraceae bacterium]